MAGEWNAADTGSRATGRFAAVARVTTSSTASGRPDTTTWVGPLIAATTAPVPAHRCSTTGALAPMLAMAPGARASSAVNRPRSSASFHMASVPRTPAQASAVSSPRECPTAARARMPRRCSTVIAASEASAIAGCATSVRSSGPSGRGRPAYSAATSGNRRAQTAPPRRTGAA